jgi:hypothetical protein
MIHLERHGTRLCDGLTRRRWLSAGTLGALGFTLADWFQARVLAGGQVARTPQARACIQIFLWGGPGAQETWDLKPDAPEGCRGEFRPIATSVAGTQICEHLPLLAQRADQYAIVRSLTHTGVNHGTSAYHMLTGHIHAAPGTLRHPAPTDMPNLGANAARFLPHPNHLPPHVHLPAVINDGDGLPVPGQGAGVLGEAHAPFAVLGDMTRPDFRVPALALAEGVSRRRLTARDGLRRAIDADAGHLARSSQVAAYGESSLKALDLLQSDKTASAFDLAAEPAEMRERYGPGPFGQSLVLARRLVEAGVPFVTVYWDSPQGNASNLSWDTHLDQHRRMRDHLLPPFDRGMSALLDDLAERDMQNETLVTWYGEFGRTPKINGQGGRDHWGFCQSVGLAGGGIRPGIIHGSSTRDGGYPATDSVSPDDLAATIFHLLGIDHHQSMQDLSGRPIPLSYGEPVGSLLS